MARSLLFCKGAKGAWGDGLFIAWPGLLVAWTGPVMVWPDLVMAWPGLVMAWPGLVVALLGITPRPPEGSPGNGFRS